MIPQTQTGLCFDIDVIQSQGYELSKDDKRYLKEVEEKQAQLHAKLKAMKQLTADEEQALNCATHDEFAGFWSRYCDRAHEEFVDKHEHGWRRWTKKSQDYAKEVEDFMNDFKPAIDAAKEFGKPWSGIAIGTLAFLFVVSGQIQIGCWRQRK
jgi:Zn-dependent oligopeptidase